jgi:hypothetical protein
VSFDAGTVPDLILEYARNLDDFERQVRCDFALLSILCCGKVMSQACTGCGISVGVTAHLM